MKMGLFVAGAAAGLLAGSASGQTGTLILEDWDGAFHLIQGGKLVGTIERVDAKVAAPFVAIGSIKSSPMRGDGKGYEYSFDGQVLGSYDVPPHEGQHDAATDGRLFIYTVQNFCDEGQVWRMDLDWQDPALLFTIKKIEDQCGLGAAYDLVNDTLWVQTYWPPGLLCEYDLSGNLVRSFPSVGETGGLAYEKETDTLWTAYVGQTWRLAQYDKNGTLLQSFAVEGLPSGPYHTAEFMITYEDDCFADFNGDGVLDLFDFLGFVNAFNEGQSWADCDEDAVLSLFDFLCFVNAFNGGC